MRNLLLLTLFVMLGVSALHAQNNEKENDFGIHFKGFVKTDLMLDTRETVSIREGHFLLYPAPEFPDMADEDINEKTNLNMLSIQTRLTGAITAPDAFGAKTSGVIEGAFFGHSNGDINGFRLRHAFLKLDWEKSSLLVGQYWHPLFITDCFPGVVSFNTGVPFQPFSRNPQIRFTQDMGTAQLQLTASTQRDFSSTGPNGGSSVYLRNSAMPMMNALVRFDLGSVAFGFSGDYKVLTPRTFFDDPGTNNPVKTDETIGSFSALFFAKYQKNEFSWKAEGFYGQNATDLVMLGGYAETAFDQTTGEPSYTNINTLSFWTDLSYGKKFAAGLFFGYTKNLGADDDIAGNVYSRGANIEQVMRISPRVVLNSGKTRFAAELEYTSASYGAPNVKGEVENAEAVANLRLLLAAYLFF